MVRGLMMRFDANDWPEEGEKSKGRLKSFLRLGKKEKQAVPDETSTEVKLVVTASKRIN